jgi:hypothetical protein
MANSFTFYTERMTLGLLDSSQQLTPPLELPKEAAHRPLLIQCTQVQISDRIPNVFNGYPFGYPLDNTTLRVGTDVHAYVTIALTPGLYLDADMLEAAINAAINSMGWWTNPADPGFTLTANSVIDRFIINIDSTKLAVAHGTQFKIDFTKAVNNSDFYYLIGFTPTTELIADGLYTSPNLPIMESQGTACIIELDLMPVRKFGNADRRVLAEVSFAGKTSPSDSIWPQGGQISPELVYNGNRTIKSYSVRVRTRNDQPMIFMGGILTFTVVFL